MTSPTTPAGNTNRGSGTLARAGRKKHIVEELIEERAQKLVKSPFWPLYRAVLYPILKHRQAVAMADAVGALNGIDGLNHISDLLKLDVSIKGLENIPKTGRVLIAPNHPTGIADGIAMFDALKNIRPDQIYFANRDAVRVAPHLGEVLIPVEWVAEKRTRQRSRETLISTKDAFSDERCIVLFPSGRLAFMDENKVLTEQEWMPSIAIFARKYDCPVIPVHIKARNSWLYYWFWRVNTELRDITLFNELLNKKKQRFEITFGEAIPADALNGEPTDVAAKLRDHSAKNVLAGKPWEPLPDDASIKSDNLDT